MRDSSSRYRLRKERHVMTVPRIGFPFVGSTLGGSHLSALLLIGQLPAVGFEPRIIVHERGQLTDYLDAQHTPYDLFELPHLLRSGGILRPCLDLVRLTVPLINYLRHNQIALVHGNDGRVNQTWTLPTRLSGRPYIWHQRARFDQSRLRKLIAKRSSALLCVSQYARGRLPISVLHESAEVIFDPFATDEAPPNRPCARRDLLRMIGVDDDVSLIGFCGSLTEQKRPQLFIDVAAKLAKLHPKAHFVLIGTDRDSLWPALESRCHALAIRDRIHFIGFRAPGIYWLSALDVLLAPQVEEAFGRTLVEAMLAGTPVVASRSGGHIEVIDDGETGILVPADDATAFARAVTTLLDDFDVTLRITAAARKNARDTYSVLEHARHIARVYDRQLRRAETILPA